MLNNNIIQLTLELIIGFIVLLISVKVIGKRQVSQITPFDFISAIVMGELLGNAIYDEHTNILYVIYAVILWTILLKIIEKVTQKSLYLRSKIQGTPSFIIKEGIIQYETLKKEGLDINEMLTQFRDKDIFSITDVDYALLEPSGKISIIQKANSNSPTLTFLLIFNGEIHKNNLGLIEQDKEWLLTKLNENNIKNINDVLYAEFDTSTKEIYIQKQQPKQKN